MDTTRITMNIEEKDIFLNAIKDQQETITELYNKQIIDSDTYYSMLDETCNELYAEEEEDYIDEEFEYIYRVELVGMGKPKILYYKDAEETHYFLNLDYDIGRVKVRYIRVSKSSPEYQSAFYNSNTNNIKIAKGNPKDDISKNNIFFSKKVNNEI